MTDLKLWRNKIVAIRIAALAGIVALSVIGFGAFDSATVHARPVTGSFADLVEKSQPTVVNISTTQRVKHPVRRFPKGFPMPFDFEDFFRRFEGGPNRTPDRSGEKPEFVTRESQSLGSGFIIDPNGYIATNNHVISAHDGGLVDKITVVLSNGKKYPAKVIGHDAASDLALLKINAKNLPYVQWGDSSKLRVGDWIIAIGNPYGLGGTVTAGIVSALHRNIGGAYNRYIQTDAAINRGNSGGPTFDMRGRVIGVSAAIWSPSGGNVGIGFVIPSEQASKVLNQIRKKGKVVRGWLGVTIQPVTEETAESLGLSGAFGALVARVTPSSPASRAGIHQGDIITEFDGSHVKDNASLPPLVADTPLGRTVSLKVLRGGRPVRLRVTVGEMPTRIASANRRDGPLAPEPPERKQSTSDHKVGQYVAKVTGLRLKPLTPVIRQQLGLPDSMEGLVITNVNAMAQVARNLRKGDVILSINYRRVKSLKDVDREIKVARKGKRNAMLLLVRSGKDEIYVPIRLKPES